MLCAISGESPQEPVASRKSGNVFERSLIEAYIRDNASDPITGEDLTLDDLIPLKNARAVKPRPPTLTSIPSLLSTFQNEWDALALETFTLRQQLQQARQELSTSLYENDAALRVIARLSRERDEARDALARIRLGDSTTVVQADEDAMQLDSAGLSDDLKALIDETQARLSKTRRKRPVPADWASTDDVQEFTLRDPVRILPNGGTAMSLARSGATAWVAGSSSFGSCSIPDVEMATSLQDVSAPVTDILVQGAEGSEAPVLATSTGVLILPDGTSLKSHKAAVSALAVHPSGRILASASLDKSFAFYDLQSNEEVKRHITNTPLLSCAFHPDGHIFAVGGQNGNVLVFNTKDVELAAPLEHDSPVKALSFSENGIWLAVATEGSTIVTIWHLGKIERIKTLDFAAQINQLKFDYTGQFLAGAGPSGVVIMHFDKKSKEWSEQVRRAAPAVKLDWGPHAKSLVVLNADGAIQCTA